jgi:2-polyprenyl-6-methoxyphenol hydroxylase-like FAD-dependent oxidoreductase
MVKPITIVGGGLAGLTLGIGLRQCGVPVMVHDAGNYPRHRVCGEFISGHGQATLARLDLRELLEQAGAVSAQTAAFFSATGSTSPHRLPSSALCLSRFILDAALVKNYANWVVNYAKANAHAPGIFVKASSALRVVGCLWKKTVRAGLV